ncbi:MAG: hypothetical protein ING12_03380 [Roseomonas sp.]|nr:hypothetical protein [Roseomonas sp.]
MLPNASKVERSLSWLFALSTILVMLGGFIAIDAMLPSSMNMPTILDLSNPLPPA